MEPIRAIIELKRHMRLDRARVLAQLAQRGLITLDLPPASQHHLTRAACPRWATLYSDQLVGVPPEWARPPDHSRVSGNAVVSIVVTQESENDTAESILS